MNRKLFNAQISQYATNTVSGEGSVTLEDNVRCYLPGMQVEGKTFQQTYTGHQQLHILNTNGSQTDSDGNVLSWDVKDGIITVNGISNTDVYINLAQQLNGLEKIVLPAGTYTYTPYYYRESGQSIHECEWDFTGSASGTHTYLYTSADSGIATQTFDEDFYVSYVVLYLSANTQFTNYKYTPALLKGTYSSLDNLPSYEPYVGGIPSPNPGQTIKQYKTEEKSIDLTNQLQNDTVYTDDYGYMCVFTNPIIPEDKTQPIVFSVGSFSTGNESDALMIADSESTILTGTGSPVYLAMGDGHTYYAEINPADYPNGIYVGVGNTGTGMNGNIDSYRQLALDAHSM